MEETGVNHAVGGGDSTLQAVQILKITPMDLGTSGGKRLGGGIGARQTEHLVSRCE